MGGGRGPSAGSEQLSGEVLGELVVGSSNPDQALPPRGWGASAVTDEKPRWEPGLEGESHPPPPPRAATPGH